MDGWKSKIDDYYFSAFRLYESMKALGFIEHEAVPVDEAGELLGGAHRLACALALGLVDVPVRTVETKAWAPPWHREWFVEHGMRSEDLARLDADWALLNA